MFHRSLFFLFVTLTVTVWGLFACSDDAGTDPHGSADGGTDSGPDARFDSAQPHEDAFSTDGGGGLIADPIQTEFGPIAGIESDGVHVYKGIPYAAPPVGPLRWKPPQAPESWTDPRQTTTFGHACPQHENSVFSLSVGEQDEDCLYLNVWSPALRETDALPVMVWIHGGGFVSGSANLGALEDRPLYDGLPLARDRNVVVVTFNYRLGQLGFMAHPELSAEDPSNISGNYGLKDQIFALQWVRDNIRRFGGDPENVTVFGESAGAASVSILMTSPPATPLFQRAVAQSGAAPGLLRHCSEDTWLDSQETLGLEFAQQLGVTTQTGAVAELRAMSWEEILAADDMQIQTPGGTSHKLLCVDGHIIPEVPLAVFEAGGQSAAPLIIGTNEDEGYLFAQAAQVSTIGELETLLSMVYTPQVVSELIDLYDVQQDAEAGPAYAQILTDGFICAARRMVRAHAAAGNPAYLYHFTRALEWMQNRGMGAYHGFEVAYVFGTLPAQGGYTSADAALSEAMMGYWSRFGAHGDPSGGQAVDWPVYQQAGDRHLVLDLDIAPGSNLRKPYCDYYDDLYN
jgi:para-nitrobenzyl esterase